MLRTSTKLLLVFVIAIGSVPAAKLVAQSALAQLTLTDTAARNFVLNEIKAPAADRRAPIVITGTRAFLKLPAPARAAAAAGLFAWAKAYVSSPAFKASYDGYRNDRVPRGRQYELSVEEATKREMDETRAAMEEMKKNLAASGRPPSEQEKIMTWGLEAHYETGRGNSASAPGLVKGLTDVKSLSAAASTTIAVLGSGRMMTWGEVRPWTRPDGGQADLSPFPMLLWLDGLEQP